MSVLLSLNVPPEKVATYSGLAESLVSLGDLIFLPLVSSHQFTKPEEG
jgi:hypothetical protein